MNINQEVLVLESEKSELRKRMDHISSIIGIIDSPNDLLYKSNHPFDLSIMISEIDERIYNILLSKEAASIHKEIFDIIQKEEYEQIESCRVRLVSI